MCESPVIGRASGVWPDKVMRCVHLLLFVRLLSCVASPTHPAFVHLAQIPPQVRVDHIILRAYDTLL